MTEEQYRVLCEEWDALHAKYPLVMSKGECVLDGIMHALAETVEHEKDKQTDELVVSCLDGCVEHLRHAAMDYYVSTK